MYFYFLFILLFLQTFFCLSKCHVFKTNTSFALYLIYFTKFPCLVCYFLNSLKQSHSNPKKPRNNILMIFEKIEFLILWVCIFDRAKIVCLVWILKRYFWVIFDREVRKLHVLGWFPVRIDDCDLATRDFKSTDRFTNRIKLF